MDKTKDINKIRDLFKELGCVSEGATDGYFSMEIPSSVDYKIIKEKLDSLEMQEIIGYAEPCLSDKHLTSTMRHPKYFSRSFHQIIGLLTCAFASRALSLSLHCRL